LLRQSHTLIALLYDLTLARATADARRNRGGLSVAIR